MTNPLRVIAGKLPTSWQQSLKRRRYAGWIRKGTFKTDEAEFARLAEWLNPGDWSIDVGANLGVYTLGMSKLVGPAGRVLSLEPIPETFELLAANCTASTCRNVTLISAAASSTAGVVGMAVPVQATGRNYYEASIQESVNGDGYHVLCVTLDSLPITGRVSLIKIDAEGHEAKVIDGAKAIIARDRPTIIAEGLRSHPLFDELGYVGEHVDGSPNFVWRPT